MAVIPFSEWRPDMPALSQWAQEALNVVAGEEAYKPLNGLQGVTGALSATCYGATWFRTPSGPAKVIAGNATNLFFLAGGTNFTAISRTSGGAYACTTGNWWRFTQFGTLAIAVDGVDAPQSLDLSIGTNFQNLAGSPPVAAYCATVNDFVVLGNIATLPQRIQWSGLNNANIWGAASSIFSGSITYAAFQADIQDLPDGGNVTGVFGGEYGVILQEAAVRRLTYIGPPVVFRIDVLSNGIGCSIPGSAAGVLDMVFFYHQSGFYMVQGGQNVIPIGKGKVDKFFAGEFDFTNQLRCSATIDPVRALYIVAYPSNGSGGQPNRLLIYHWRTQKWTHAQVTVELVYSSISQQSWTLDSLNNFNGGSTLETLPFSLDSSYWNGVLSLLLFGFDTTHKTGPFAGPSLAATVVTTEINPGEGKRFVIRGCRPLVDGGSPMVSVASRESQQGSVVFGPGEPVGVAQNGYAPLYDSGRYFRFMVQMSAGDTWSNLQGIDDIDGRVAGNQ